MQKNTEQEKSEYGHFTDRVKVRLEFDQKNLEVRAKQEQEASSKTKLLKLKISTFDGAHLKSLIKFFIQTHVKQRTTGKVQFLVSSTFLLVLTKFSFWEEDLALGYTSITFWHFLNIFWFAKTLSLKSFGNSYIPCLWLIITLRFTCGEREIYSTIKMSQNIMRMILFNFFFFLLSKPMLTVSVAKNSHILALIYFIFLRKRLRPNLKGFQWQISVKRLRN